MALKVIYEGIPAGELELNTTDLDTAANSISAGMLSQLDANGDVSCGASAASLDRDGKPIYGIVADDKDDIIASGKVTVYITPGKYATDMYVASGLDENAVIAIDEATGTIILAVQGDYPAGYVTKAPADGWIEFMFMPSMNKIA